MIDIHLPGVETEKLVTLYRDLNIELNQRLLQGASWEEVRGDIALLSDMAKELGRRKAPIPSGGSSPADFQFRK